MAEINQSVALGGKAPENNELLKAASTYATMAQATAHAGLYSLEAQKQQMFISAANKYSQTGDPNAFSEIGHPDVAKGIIDSQKERADFQNKQDATYSYYASQLPPGQMRDQVVNNYLSTAVKNNWMTPVEASQRGQFYAQDPDRALQAGMQKHPEAVAAASQNAALIAREQGQTAAKQPYEIARTAATEATREGLSKGRSGEDVADIASGVSKRILSNFGVGQQGSPQPTPASGQQAAPAQPPSAAGQAAQPAPQRQSFGGVSMPYYSGLETRYGLPQGYLPTTVAQETKNQDPNEVSSTGATGLMQFTRGTAKDYNLSDRTDGYKSIEAGAKLAADNMRTMKDRIGRDPTGPELYLGHNQGAGGASALINHPNSRAGDIVGDQAISVNGGDPNMRASDFTRMKMGQWQAKQQQYGFGQGQGQGAGGVGTGQAPQVTQAPMPPVSQGPVQAQRSTSAPAGPQAMPKIGMSPEEIDEQKSSAKWIGETPQRLGTIANAANEGNTQMESALNASKNAPMGKGTGVWADLMRLTQPYFNSIGMTFLNDPVKFYEELQKNSGQMLREQVKLTGSRVGVQEYKLVGNSVPSADMSHGGFEATVRQLQGVNDFHLAKQQAAEDWATAHGGTYKGFEADWNKNYTPTAFMLHRMNPDERKQLVTEMNKTEQGRAVLQNVMQTVQRAKDNGYFKE